MILLLGSKGLVGTAISKMIRGDGIVLGHEDVDVTDKRALRAVLTRFRPSTVINATGMVGVNPCEENPTEAFKLNAQTVSDMVDICNDLSVTLVQMSTHSVFNGKKRDYYNELDQPDPLNVYGRTKYASELATERCGKYYIIRMPTLFGDRQKGKLGFPNKIFEMLREGKDVQVAGDKLDSCSYSNDIASGIMYILYSGKPYGIYHVANDGKATYYKFIKEAARIMKSKSKVIKCKDSDFMKYPNALRTAMTSIKLPIMRSWQEALEDYLSDSEL